MRSLRSALWLLPVASLAAPLVGCSNTPIDPTALAEQASLHAREVVHQAGGGVAFTQQDDSGLSRIVSGMGNASDGLAGMAQALPPGMMSAMSDSPMMQAAAGVPSLQTTEEQFDDTADDMRAWLRQRVLADENLETKSDDEAIYLLQGEPTCRALPREGDPPGQPPSLDTKCVDQLTKLQVRVVLRADGDGARLTVKAGPDRLELSSFIIHSNLVAIEADLAKAYAASQFIDQTLGTDSPMGDQRLEALEGVVRVSLRKDGERKATFALSVLQAIHVAMKDTNGAPGPDVRLAATDPVFALSADGVAQTATLKLDMGALDVLADWNPQGAPGTIPNRDLHVAVGGLTGSTTFTENNDEVVAKGLGIGTSSVRVRGASIVELGLNPSDQHRFDLRVSLDAAGQPHFDVTPRFDLSVGLHFGAVAADFARENQPPSWVLDETYAVKLDNGGQTSTIAGAPATDTFGGGLKVGPGSLTLSTTASGVPPVVVPAGKCLTGNSTPPSGAHPILGALQVVDCP